MRRFAPVALLLAFLVACGSPTSAGPPTAAPTSVPTSIPTVNVAPTQTRTAELALIAALQATAQAPTATVPPTATIAPTAIPQPPTSTSVPLTRTRVPATTISPTRTPTVTPTPAPDMGLPFTDDFADPTSGWIVAEQGLARTEYRDGEYRIRFGEPDLLFHARNRRVRGADVSVGVTASFTEGGAGFNGIGLLCRIQDDNKGYYSFVLFANGHIKIDRARNDLGSALVSSAVDPQLAPLKLDGGPVALRADCVGDTFSFSVDGRVVARVRDTTYRTGSVGLAVCTCEGPPVDVRFDDFWARAVPRAARQRDDAALVVAAGGAGLPPDPRRRPA